MVCRHSAFPSGSFRHGFSESGRRSCRAGLPADCCCSSRSRSFRRPRCRECDAKSPPFPTRRGSLLRLPGTPALYTPVPEGYAPFNISHYGRHGSRWLLHDREDTDLLDLFDRAVAADALSARRDLLAECGDNYEYNVTRGLSPLNRRFPQYDAKVLVEEMLDRADRVVAGDGPAADLRFGHDGNIVALCRCSVSRVTTAGTRTARSRLSNEPSGRRGAGADPLDKAEESAVTFFKKVTALWVSNKKGRGVPFAPFEGCAEIAAYKSGITPR